MSRVPLPVAGLIAAAALLAGCSAVPAPPPQPAPAPLPPPRPAPQPAPAPAPTPPLAADWRDWPATQGTWAYRQDARGSIALFGQVGSDAELTLRCDRERGQLYLARRIAPGTGDARLMIRTTSLARTLDAAAVGDGVYAAATLATRDALLDAIAYSRGRFAVEGGGLAPLAVPAWAEIGRVVEDCRRAG
ncbi:hypothetical protein [Sphingomonas sp.]|uniref:hypothetical protein n=1 Tax=Sphingomonas sp. TaxID=28214 RepID=UPI001B23C094|nr:hypothetical protein [Sphingomonas sp.]MBO9713178.1 hypothetical protein [Sphingomonas sp.]